jgi:hypothetical protein
MASRLGASGGVSQGDPLMQCGPAANKFGEFVVKNLWDKSFEFYDLLARGHWKAPSLQELQDQLAAFSDEQRDVVRRCIAQSLSHGLHQLLLAIVDAYEMNQGISMIVDGVNIVEQSDGLHGEIFGEDGWMAKYSEYAKDYPEV